MSYVTETLSNLIHQTAFFNLYMGKLSDDRGGVCILIPCYQKRI